MKCIKIFCEKNKLSNFEFFYLSKTFVEDQKNCGLRFDNSFYSTTY